MRSPAFALLVLRAAAVHAQDKWCNKNYMADSPIEPPGVLISSAHSNWTSVQTVVGGKFEFPEASDEPLLSLRCGQAIRPYLEEDVQNSDPLSSLEILVDTPIVYSKISGALPINIGSDSTNPVTGSLVVSVDGKTLAEGEVALNTSKVSLTLDLNSVSAQVETYNMTCTLTFDDQVYSTTSALSYLPNPAEDYTGSVVKLDMRTGGLLARPATGEDGPYERVYPVGFYTNFGGYLSKNLSVIAELKAQG